MNTPPAEFGKWVRCGVPEASGMKAQVGTVSLVPQISGSSVGPRPSTRSVFPLRRTRLSLSVNDSDHAEEQREGNHHNNTAKFRSASGSRMFPSSNSGLAAWTTARKSTVRFPHRQ